MSSFGCANPTTCPYGGRCDYGCSLNFIQPEAISFRQTKSPDTPKTPKTPKFKRGDRVNKVLPFTEEVKTGEIVRFRNDDWEETHNHPRGNYYYSVKYDDGSFETYESEGRLLLVPSQSQDPPKPKFTRGDRVNKMAPFTEEVEKTGEIKCLRNDEWEKIHNHPDGRYYYSVTYDDGSFETYELEDRLRMAN